MPKNVIILEGGKGLRFADVSKLITDKTGGNDSWVPTEDRIIRQKYISENGIYYANDDGIYGFSKLTVNIPGGAQGHTVPTVSTLPYGVEVSTTDPSQPMPIIPGTVGSSVMGLDPDTGYVSTATVKPNGEFEITAIPQAIAITKMPNKLKYNDGDEIDYTGIEVSLYVKYEETSSGGSIHVDAVPFSDERYPDGKIPFDELIFPVQTADASEASPYSGDGVNIDIVTMTMYSTAYNVVQPGYNYYEGKPFSVKLTDARGGYAICPELIIGSSYMMTVYEDRYWLKAVLESDAFTNGSVGLYWIEPDGYPAVTSSFLLINGWKRIDSQASNTSFVSTSDDFLLLGGDDLKSRQTIPVQWISPYDGKTYETSFKIEVEDDEPSEGGSSEGGSSEGGGGGHSF